jgi:hypothetical protein
MFSFAMAIDWFCDAVPGAALNRVTESVPDEFATGVGSHCVHPFEMSEINPASLLVHIRAYHDVPVWSPARV